MPVNDTIRVLDYNAIRNKAVEILGVGSATKGYGQFVRSSAVAEGNTITINEWSNLRWDLINSRVHQIGSIPGAVTVVSGDTIRYSLSDAPVDTFNTLADTVTADSFLLGPGQFATNVPTTASTRTTAWNSSLSCTVQYSWPTANQARHFFNSGGQVRVTVSRSGGTASQQNSAWTSLFNTAGTRSFGGNNPGQGTSPPSGVNWYRSSDTFQTFYSVTSSSPYGNNLYTMQSRVTDGVNNATGTSRSGEIRLLFTDGYTDPGPPEPGDTVDGTLTVAVDLIFATGILYPIGSGNFTVVLPAVAIGAITGS